MEIQTHSEMILIHHCSVINCVVRSVLVSCTYILVCKYNTVLLEENLMPVGKRITITGRKHASIGVGDRPNP